MTERRDIFAIDAKTARTTDADGHLHIAGSPISKAIINQYRGDEVPDFEALGLDPKKLYRLLRDPKELEKAAPTWEGKPLLIVHRGQTAEDHDREVVVGSVNNPRWDAPYVRADQHVWDGEAIDGIANNKRRELSSSYRYRADMTPGTYEGGAYDGVMRDIVGNHVALVPEGRAGSDVMVADAKPTPASGDTAGDLFHLEDYTMGAPALSRKALRVEGALVAYLVPKLAADAKIDLRAVLHGTTALNYGSAKRVIADKLADACRGKLAKDASLTDVHGLLDRLDGVGNGEGNDEDPDPAPAADEEGEAEGSAEKVCALLEGKVSPEVIEHIRTIMGAGGEAEDTAMPKMPSDAEMEGKTDAEKAKMSKDAKAARDKWSKDKAAKDAAVKAAKDAESLEEKEKREKMEKEKAEKDKADDRATNKKAMDSAIAAGVATAVRDAVAKTKADMRAIADAQAEIEPLVGRLLAQDSAEATYKVALEHLGVDLKEVPPSVGAFRALLKAQRRPGRVPDAPAFAHDAGGDDFIKKLPHADRLLHVAI